MNSETTSGKSTPLFHPAVSTWFENTFETPTAVQIAAWPRIANEERVLIAAPTGSGKTLAAFLCAINELVQQTRHGALEDKVHVLYISPLKALSNDIEKNLQAPLLGIADELLASGEIAHNIRAAVRTGDTPTSERTKMSKRPPHILVTTPESLYLLLTSVSGRNMLAGVSTLIVDEIHALASNKRGSHLALSLARLDALCGSPPARIGLSATQKPIKRIADYLCGGQQCAIVDTGHKRHMDIKLVLPESPLAPVLSNEVWEELYERLVAYIRDHRTTLIFVNTRRLAERIARHLAERLGEDAVTAHHGSLSRTHRLEAEQALKTGQLKALVATASLELGIDIGHVDLVCQMGTPGSISALLQRIGRSGHAVGETPKGRLFPLSRDDLVECVALQKALELGELDAIVIPRAPLDVLAQQLVAEVSARDWQVDDLLQVVCAAWPYHDLTKEQFLAVVRMLADGYSTRRGRRSALLFYDAINGHIRARPAARLTALQNGGAIPDHFDYEVIMLPQGHRIGTLNEDFAFESVPGDIFQLGNTSYRMLKIEQGRVLVEDAHGQPPTIPFWLGDKPGRSDELSLAVSTLRFDIEERLKEQEPAKLIEKLGDEGVSTPAAIQLVEYLHASMQALGCLPTRDKIVMERFFDDSGDMHLVIHAPLGSRLMRAWGLALRKRFCRQFNFELQASALEDSLILSLGETHSFEIADVADYLKPETVRDVLIQALLDAPMFELRWRWNATIALAVQRMRNGKKLPPQWQRNQAEDLVAVVFPDQIACFENIRGSREIPDHPLVNQTIDDCLTDTMDIDGLEDLLTKMAAGDVEIISLDLVGPSPLSREIINARPYAFLDDGEAENRRTRAIGNDPDDLSSAATLSIISVEARTQVRDEAWIQPRNADELHDGLLQLGFLTSDEYSTGNSSCGAGGTASQWGKWFSALGEDFRVCSVSLDRTENRGVAHWWLASERLPEWLAIHPFSQFSPDPTALLPDSPVYERDEALVVLLRSRMSGLGPVSRSQLAMDFDLDEDRLQRALLSLQNEGFAILMQDDATENLWCERRLLARIHRYSREQRRRAVKPVSPATYMNFLVRWHAMDDAGADLDQALSSLQGWSAPAAMWEHHLLSARCKDYSPEQLDQRFLSGQLAWFRPSSMPEQTGTIVSATPLAIVPRSNTSQWLPKAPDPGAISDSTARKILHLLEKHGAMFTPDLEQESGLLRPQLEQALKTLIAAGVITSDAFSPVRWLLRPEAQKLRRSRQAKRHAPNLPVGRWSITGTGFGSVQTESFSNGAQQRLAVICQSLLRRYGVVFRAVIQRETLLPPWRELLNYLRRMEDRGEVRGGRFVDGFSGEQFALPEALGLLRQPVETNGKPIFTIISACDPLNLGGLIVPGVKTPSITGNRVLLENGLPVARMIGEEFQEFANIGAEASREARRRLLVVRPWRNLSLVHHS
ncbi:MAG: DEAD/DEAH box helicase [Xanthomonadales bacterium]|nr:DEAD/DEAH box helicase [Xanthomonadales bacterium]